MTTNHDRREFLGVAAGAGVGWLAADSASCPADNPRAEAVTIVRDVPAEHYELLKRRSARTHEALQNSLKHKDARPVTVAVWQMRNHCGGAQGKRDNLARMTAAIAHAAKAGVQVLAFPEMCLPGYFTSASGTPAEAVRANAALADAVGSEPLLELAKAARGQRMVVAFGFAERAGDKLYNAIGLIDADGAWLGVRRKNPLSPTPFELDSFTEPKPSERSAVFRTRYGAIGLLNCFDGEFPETVRRMRLAGAEIVLWCNAATGNPALGHSNRLHHCASYAQANLMWLACCNAVGGSCYGTSLIVGPPGELLVMLPTDQEALGVCTINLAQSADWERYRTRLDPACVRE
jgi:predicted amidohydrolase